MWGFRAEPAGISFAVRAVLLAVIGFGLVDWTEPQLVLVLGAVDAVLTLFVRSASTSINTLQRAGLSQKAVVKMAFERKK